jgi:hypothetical protein
MAAVHCADRRSDPGRATFQPDPVILDSGAEAIVIICRGDDGAGGRSVEDQELMLHEITDGVIALTPFFTNPKVDHTAVALLEDRLFVLQMTYCSIRTVGRCCHSDRPMLIVV